MEFADVDLLLFFYASQTPSSVFVGSIEKDPVLEVYT